MPISPEDIKTLEEKHGERIAHVKSRSSKDGAPLWECVFRKPTRAEWKHYKRQCHLPAEVADAQETLSVKCVVFPDRAAFDALLNAWPAIPESCVDVFNELLGIGVEAQEKGLGISASSSGNPSKHSRTV